MVMAWSCLSLATFLLTVCATALSSSNDLDVAKEPACDTDACDDASSAEVSFLQLSIANTLAHASPLGTRNPLAGAGKADEKIMQLFAQRTGGADWPNPGDPSYQITPEHRLTVSKLKSAVAARDVNAINATVAGMALLPVKLDIEEGVYPLIFSVLHDYQDDKYQGVQMNAWRGLSDQSASVLGAPLIANFGGPNQGIEFMVHQMQAHPEPYYGLCADHLTVKYEILACILGLLIRDDGNVWGPAAVREGLLDQILYTMRVEPDLIASQATACKVMGSLLFRNPRYAFLLNEKGGLELVESAMERFKDGDDTPFYFGNTMGSFYNVTQACGVSRAILLGAKHLASTVEG